MTADPPAPAVTIGALSPEAIVDVRGNPADSVFLDALGAVTGSPPPLTPNRVAAGDGHSILWLGPDEWLIIAAPGSAPALERELRARAGTDPWLSVVDLSQSLTGFRLEGPAACELLSKGCTLDLESPAGKPGACAATLLAGVRVLIVVTESGFEIRVRNSFALFLSLWLEDALEEWRFQDTERRV